MGIYDRDYYRRETAGSLWLTGRTPVTFGLVVANVVVFLLQGPLGMRGAWLQSWLQLEADKVFVDWEVWRLLTATFCHGGIWHLFGNMLFLWWFGRGLEMLYGSREFLVFYLTAGVVSSLSWAIVTWFSASGRHIPMVGASGAVTAVMVLYAMYNPRERILFYGFIPIEVRWMVFIYLAADLYGLFGVEYSPIAHVAHLGGAGYAVLYKYADLRMTRLVRRRIRRPRLRIVRPEPPPEVVDETRSLDEALEHRMDAVLAKIAREGPQSLNDQERKVLEEASRRLRSRRG